MKNYKLRTHSDEKTEAIVIFRRYRTKPYEVVALLPELVTNRDCITYEHIGQHGQAIYSDMIYITKPAHDDEPDVIALKQELESIGYVLTVKQRYTFK